MRRHQLSYKHPGSVCDNDTLRRILDNPDAMAAVERIDSAKN
jgi:hypothetical protein